MLDRALEGTECLRPEAVLAAIPEQERRSRHTRDRHGAPGRGADPPRERDPILEGQIRLVARAAGDTAVGTQSGVEEQPAAEIRGPRIVGNAIRRVAREWLERRERHRSE